MLPGKLASELKETIIQHRGIERLPQLEQSGDVGATVAEREKGRENRHDSENSLH